MNYIRTDEIKSKQSAKMKEVHKNKPYDYVEIEKKRKESLRKSGKKTGRRPGEGRPRAGEYKPCPVCTTPVYHKQVHLKEGISKCCSRDCARVNPATIAKLKSIDRSYTQTEEFKDKHRKDSTPAYKKYKNIVGKLTDKTYAKYIDVINPDRLPRTIAGVEGGYQLDHIKSVRECFDEGVDPEVCADVNNLRMLPWKENLMRTWNK